MRSVQESACFSGHTTQQSQYVHSADRMQMEVELVTTHNHQSTSDRGDDICHSSKFHIIQLNQINTSFSKRTCHDPPTVPSSRDKIERAVIPPALSGGDPTSLLNAQ